MSNLPENIHTPSEGTTMANERRVEGLKLQHPDALKAVKMGESLTVANIQKNLPNVAELLPKSAVEITVTREGQTTNELLAASMYEKPYARLTDDQKALILTLEMILDQQLGAQLKNAPNAADRVANTASWVEVGDKISVDFDTGGCTVQRKGPSSVWMEKSGTLVLDLLDIQGERIREESKDARLQLIGDMRERGLLVKALDDLDQDSSFVARKRLITTDSALRNAANGYLKEWKKAPLKADASNYSGTEEQNHAVLYALLDGLEAATQAKPDVVSADDKTAEELSGEKVTSNKVEFTMPAEEEATDDFKVTGSGAVEQDKGKGRDKKTDERVSESAAERPDFSAYQKAFEETVDTFNESNPDHPVVIKELAPYKGIDQANVETKNSTWRFVIEGKDRDSNTTERIPFYVRLSGNGAQIYWRDGDPTPTTEAISKRATPTESKGDRTFSGDSAPQDTGLYLGAILQKEFGPGKKTKSSNDTSDKNAVSESATERPDFTAYEEAFEEAVDTFNESNPDHPVVIKELAPYKGIDQANVETKNSTWRFVIEGKDRDSNTTERIPFYVRLSGNGAQIYWRDGDPTPTTEAISKRATPTESKGDRTFSGDSAPQDTGLYLGAILQKEFGPKKNRDKNIDREDGAPQSKNTNKESSENLELSMDDSWNLLNDRLNTLKASYPNLDVRVMRGRLAGVTSDKGLTDQRDSGLVLVGDDKESATFAIVSTVGAKNLFDPKVDVMAYKETRLGGNTTGTGKTKIERTASEADMVSVDREGQSPVDALMTQITNFVKSTGTELASN